MGKIHCFGFRRKISIMLTVKQMGKVLEPGVDCYFVLDWLELFSKAKRV